MNGLGNGPLRAVILTIDGGITTHLEAESGIERLFDYFKIVTHIICYVIVFIIYFIYR